MYLRIFFLGAIALLLSACSATGPRFDISKAEAVSSAASQVYLFRESAFIESGTYPVVVVDGKEIGELRNGGYLVAKVIPGPHKIVVQSGGLVRGQWIHGPKQLQIEVAPSTRRYFQLSLRTTGSSGNTIYRGDSVAEVPEAYALTALTELRLSE